MTTMIQDPDQATHAAQAEPDAAPGGSHPARRSREESLEEGKALRDKVPRALHAEWRPPRDRRDPVDVLQDSNVGRLKPLIPIRYGRMLQSPLAFLRGSAGLMAYDLASTPSSGLRVQACGDCHLMNFGLFATPERNLIFDLNDFDETLPAPWEWDLKRLAVSLAVAARDTRLSDDDARSAVVACVRAYREHVRDCSKRSPLDVWYERLDAAQLIAQAPDAETRKYRQDMAAKARRRIGEYLFPRLTREVGGRLHLVEQPPLLVHVTEPDAEAHFRAGLEDYRRSLADDRRVLFDRYRLEDFAIKVVGVGSVGTACFVALFSSADGHPLLLQFKEARESVLAPFAGPSVYQNQGQRIVVGQRLMQSSSDIFLGWARGTGEQRRHFFGRQLRDMKLSFPLQGVSAAQLRRFSAFCGETVARAHARSGDAAAIAGYVGKSAAFDDAIGSFALAYADQTVRDHAALVQAVQQGRVEALVEEEF